MKMFFYYADPGGGRSTFYIHYDNATHTRYPYDGGIYVWDGANSPQNTPFQVAMNDVTGGRWQPTAAPTSIIWSGGPPFRDGRDVVDRSYDVRQQIVPLHVRAVAGNGESAYANAVGAMTQLKRVFRENPVGAPTHLIWEPDSSPSTTALSFQVIDAEVDENPLFTNEEDGSGLLRAQLRLTLAPFGYGTSFGLSTTNNYANNSTTFFGSWSTMGDLLWEGTPAKIVLRGMAMTAGTAYTILAATCTNASTAFSYPSATATALTTATATVRTENSSISAVDTPSVPIRLMCNLSASTNPANIEMRAVVLWSNAVIAASDWRKIPTVANCLVDFGPLSLASLDGYGYSASIQLRIEARTTTGTGSVTLTHLHVWRPVMFCRADYDAHITGARYVISGVHGAYINYPQPMTPRAYLTNSSGTAIGRGMLRGDPIRAIDGMRILAIWYTTATGAMNLSDSATLESGSLATYRTMRAMGV